MAAGPFKSESPNQRLTLAIWKGIMPLPSLAGNAGIGQNGPSLQELPSQRLPVFFMHENFNFAG